MSLQSATLAAHQNAERTEFAREMMSGNMSEEKYKTFLQLALKNKHKIKHTNNGEIILTKESS